MGTVKRCYLKKKVWKGQQNEGKENYWSSPNITAKAKPISDSICLGALEKPHDYGAQMLNMDLILFGLLSKILLDKIISLCIWGDRMKIRKDQGAIKTNHQYPRVTFFLHHKHASLQTFLGRQSVNICKRNCKIISGLPLSQIRHLTEFMSHLVKRWAKLWLCSIFYLRNWDILMKVILCCSFSGIHFGLSVLGI